MRMIRPRANRVDRPSPIAVLEPQHPLLALGLARRELVAPAAERIVAGPKLDAHRRALRASTPRETSFRGNACSDPAAARLIAVHDDHRRIAPALMRIAQPHWPAAHQRRRVHLQRVLQHSIEPRRRELDAGILVRDERSVDELRDAAAVQRRDVVHARIGHEIELALDLALDEAALVTVQSVPFVDGDRERAAARGREADEVRVLIGDASRASSTAITAPASSIAFKLCTMLNFSMASDTRARRRMPAVSMSTNLLPSRSHGTWMLSRVVPGSGDVIRRFSPSRRLISVDLPTSAGR